MSKELLTPKDDPHSPKHSAEQHCPPGGPHELKRSTFAPHSFTSHAHEMTHILPLGLCNAKRVVQCDVGHAQEATLPRLLYSTG